MDLPFWRYRRERIHLTPYLCLIFPYQFINVTQCRYLCKKAWKKGIEILYTTTSRDVWIWSIFVDMSNKKQREETNEIYLFIISSIEYMFYQICTENLRFPISITSNYQKIVNNSKRKYLLILNENGNWRLVVQI